MSSSPSFPWACRMLASMLVVLGMQDAARLVQKLHNPGVVQLRWGENSISKDFKGKERKKPSKAHLMAN